MKHIEIFYKFCCILVLFNIGIFFYTRMQHMCIVTCNEKLDSIKSLILAVSRQLNESTELNKRLYSEAVCKDIITKHKRNIKNDLVEINKLIAKVTNKYKDEVSKLVEDYPIKSTEKINNANLALNLTDSNNLKNEQNGIVKHDKATVKVESPNITFEGGFGTNEDAHGLQKSHSSSIVKMESTNVSVIGKLGTNDETNVLQKNDSNLIDNILEGKYAGTNMSFNEYMPTKELDDKTGEVFPKTDLTDATRILRDGLNRIIRLDYNAMFPNSYDKVSSEDFSTVRRRLNLQYIYKSDNMKDEKLIYLTFNTNDITDRHFRDLNCINKCRIVTDHTIADAIVYKNDVGPKVTRNRKNVQVYVYVQLESPKVATPNTRIRPNWTATFRPDSVIPTPYQIYQPNSILDVNGFYRPLFNKTKNYAQGKTKKVAWFVSNCNAHNNRLQYARRLNNFINVDIYGGCGPFKCPKFDEKECLDMLSEDYKFYLSFENANCRGYITEKLFNAYRSEVVPIVMGATRDDYAAVAPPNSFIHVDDFKSERELADYLKVLDKNDTLYNSYFSWKEHGGFQNTKFICRLCAMLHAAPHSRHVSYENLRDWWGKDVCR